MTVMVMLKVMVVMRTLEDGDTNDYDDANLYALHLLQYFMKVWWNHQANVLSCPLTPLTLIVF